MDRKGKKMERQTDKEKERKKKERKLTCEE